jgi:hypothetical protein
MSPVRVKFRVVPDAWCCMESGRQLLSSDLNESRDACRINPKAVADEIIVGSQFPQTKPDPIGPREDTEVERRRLHRSRVLEHCPEVLSTDY